MKTFRRSDASRLFFAVSALLIILMLASAATASDVRFLWQSRDQFVALDSQDSSPENSSNSNKHPYEITEDRLAAMLSSVDVRTSDSSSIEPLFTKASLDVLVPQLQLGLHQALPGEDVTFAVIGLYKALYGLAKSPRVTTGRVFFKDGQLNIIFGQVQQDVNEREDRRLAPFTPGKRSSVAPGDWRLLPQAGMDMTMLRKDWVAFGKGWKAPVEQSSVPAAKTEPIQGAPVQPAKQNIDTRGPVERLTTLKELKEKGLISDEEFRVKRQEILNGL